MYHLYLILLVVSAIEISVGTLTKHDSIDVPTPGGYQSFQISDAERKGDIILYNTFERYIRVIDPETKTVKSEHTGAGNILAMATTAPDEHVMVANFTDEENKLHLLDKDFKIVYTHTGDPSKKILDLRYLSSHRFMAFECTWSWARHNPDEPFNVTFTTIRIENKSFVVEKQIELFMSLRERPWYFEVSQDETIVFLADMKSTVYRINLETKQYTSFNLPDDLPGLYSKDKGRIISHEWGTVRNFIYSISRVGDTVFLADKWGNLLLFNNDGECLDIQSNIQGTINVRDMTERNGKVYLTFMTIKRLYIYE